MKTLSYTLFSSIFLTSLFSFSFSSIEGRESRIDNRCHYRNEQRQKTINNLINYINDLKVEINLINKELNSENEKLTNLEQLDLMRKKNLVLLEEKYQLIDIISRQRAEISEILDHIASQNNTHALFSLFNSANSTIEQLIPNASRQQVIIFQKITKLILNLQQEQRELIGQAIVKNGSLGLRDSLYQLASSMQNDIANTKSDINNSEIKISNLKRKIFDLNQTQENLNQSLNDRFNQKSSTENQWERC